MCVIEMVMVLLGDGANSVSPSAVAEGWLGLPTRAAQLSHQGVASGTVLLVTGKNHGRSAESPRSSERHGVAGDLQLAASWAAASAGEVSTAETAASQL